MKPILKGPFKIVAISDDNAKYTVLNLVTMRLRMHHVSALFPINRIKEEKESDEENERGEEAKDDKPHWPNI